jgi:hypothetical protein
MHIGGSVSRAPQQTLTLKISASSSPRVQSRPTRLIPSFLLASLMLFAGREN